MNNIIQSEYCNINPAQHPPAGMKTPAGRPVQAALQAALQAPTAYGLRSTNFIRNLNFKS